ncbi:MAG: tRNA uridine(34) 5-carboxymethylaminomethyl modification radical SAM/GNAT enzyme Elp3 [Dehalococcoidia bacterium]|nr:tRNA uridine(34) 5-carboxymethylaminomethyl modification radical SAM/GNAT enzyme Elp3 [Dehalococcoidia bacterium]
MRKVSRTISGVTPVAVMTEPMGCPGECVYCPTYPTAPQSYTETSPAVIRARACDYEPRKQVAKRLRMLDAMGHPSDKVELIVMGGTFLSLPEDYQHQFIKGCYDSLNGVESPCLEEAKRLNETAGHRCVGLCIETRPDWCGQREIERMLEMGTTRVELGVQTLDDSIYERVKRGHKVADVVTATRLLKDHGFKVYYHWMPGLPGATPESDLVLSRLMFEDDRFKPDGLKLYPTLVIAGTELERWYRQGSYLPYPDEELMELLVRIKLLVPKYARIPRVMRDIPTEFIVAGSTDLNLRGTLRRRMAEKGLRCQCTRCREYGHRARDGWRIGEPKLTRMDYSASGGREVFLSFEDDDETLFGLLRLRVPFQPCGGTPDGGAAVIRELHVFGAEMTLGERGKSAQHKGLGRALIEEAERIAGEDFGAKKLFVLSGVGAKEYYRTLGYGEEGHYMVKELNGVSR